MLNFVSATKSVKKGLLLQKKISINDTQIGLVRTRIHSASYIFPPTEIDITTFIASS